MIVRYSKQFVKQLAKQPQKIQNSFYIRVDIFIENPFDPVLRNHALQGKLKGFYRALLNNPSSNIKMGA